MKSTLSSRERMLCTIHHQEPDHVPLYNVWTANYLPRFWGEATRRVREVLALGLDDTLRLSVPNHRSPEVWTRCWTDYDPASRYPILNKEYHTPRGVLRQRSHRSDDWVHGEEIPLLSLQHMARGIEFLVQGPEDVPKLAYVFTEPTAAQLAVFREEARAMQRFAAQQGVLLEGYVAGAGILAAHMFGQLSLALKLTDDPALVEETLAFFRRWTLRRSEILLDLGVDVLLYDGWADMPHFWSLEPYRRLLKPIIRDHVRLAHQAGVPCSYWLDKGLMPLRHDFLDLELDVLWGVDPIQDDVDLAVLKREIGGRICLWGGLNGAVTLSRGARDEIRAAVTTAIRTLGPGGGFVLLAVDQIFDDAPWSNVEIMIERWKEIADYPLAAD